MSKIVGIGANVCDTLLAIKSFPTEDTKTKATSATQSGGGPCATGLVAASKLGEECAYIGTLTDDSAGAFLKADLERYGVLTEFTDVKSGYTSFTSTILLSEESSSRTCVFYRGNVPGTQLDSSKRKAIENATVLMVDGNDLDAAIEGALVARNSGTKVLYDAGGLYDGVEKLLELSDILIPSEEFALGLTGATDVDEAAKILYEKFSPEVVVVTCGKNGGVMYDGKKAEKYPAFLVDAVDTNGSGDVFHGAFAFSVVKGYNYKKCCMFSSAVSALKCTKIGARVAVPTFEETIEFLKERGIDV